MIFTNNVRIDLHFVVLLSQRESLIVAFGHDEKLDGGPVVPQLQEKPETQCSLD